MKIGADPEFEWRTQGGAFVKASSVVSGLHKRLGTDGASSTGELRPRPGTPGTVNRSISSLIGSASKHQRYIMTAGSGEDVSLGGHIHFSGVISSPELIRKLDEFIALPLREISNHSFRANHNYGALGETRSQPHGWEYRSPASWISHPWISGGVMHIAHSLARAQKEDKLSEMNTIEDIIEFAKTGPEPHGAVWFLSRYKKVIDRMKRAGAKLEDVEIFQAWKKRPRKTNAPRRVKFNFRTSDTKIDRVAHWYNKSNVNEGNEEIEVVGALRSRTQCYRVYIPASLRGLFGGVIDEVWVESWENNTIGLSLALRYAPKTAAAILATIKEKIESAEQKYDSKVIDIIEGKVTT